MKKVFLFVITLFASLLLVSCGEDKELYEILVPEGNIVRKGADFNPLNEVKLVDSKGDVSTKYEVKVEGNFDVNKVGTYTLTYVLEEDLNYDPVDRTIEVAEVKELANMYKRYTINLSIVCVTLGVILICTLFVF